MGPLAFFDWFTVDHVLSFVDDMVPKTFLPILRLSAPSADAIDQAYRPLQAEHENVGWRDSPRERWRKRYGNFIREIEWSFRELRKVFPRAQYEDFVTRTCAEYYRAGINNMMGPGMRVVLRTSAFGRRDSHTWIAQTINKIHGALLFNVFNVSRWVIGDIKLKEFDPYRGEVVFEVLDCAWLRAPRMDTLPEKGCMMACKGAFERAFDEPGAPCRMQLDPHLPNTSCTIRMYWNDKPLR